MNSSKITQKYSVFSISFLQITIKDADSNNGRCTKANCLNSHNELFDSLTYSLD